MFGAIIARRKVRSAVDALSLQDIDAFLDYWADEAIFSWATPNGPGFSEQGIKMEGKEAIREWFQAFVGQWEYATFMVKNVCVKRLCPLAFGDNILMVEWDLLLKAREKPTDISSSGVAVIEVRGGKAGEVRVYECVGNPLLTSEDFFSVQA